MASKARLSTAVIELRTALEREAYRFDFFQVLRKLEAMEPDSPGLGNSAKPADDPLRLTQEPTLQFAPSSLSGFEPGKGKVPDRLATYFAGLFGPNGPLPTHLTEYALQRKLNENDPSFARFADLFHHRILSLLYRGWANVRPTVSRDRPATDRYRIYVGSLFGIGHETLQDRDALPDLAKLHYAGLLALQNRPPSGLAGLLADFFSVNAEVDEWQGAWMTVPDASRLQLGSLTTGSLGVDTVIGEKAWGRQQRFRVKVGPMRISQLWRLLPGSDAMARLIAIVRNYAGDERDWDLQLDLDTEDVQPVALGKPNRLGWTTWVGDEKSGMAAADSGVVIDDPPKAQRMAVAREKLAAQMPESIGAMLKMDTTNGPS
jgi:type VI secretion system protein ImpH